MTGSPPDDPHEYPDYFGLSWLDGAWAMLCLGYVAALIYMAFGRW